jgi:hypothetical protein
MSFIAAVETAQANRGAVTNSHIKKAAKRPNGLLEGHWVGIAKTKEQTGDRDLPLAKSTKSTHLTQMHVVDAFGGFRRISRRIGLLELIP